MKKNLGGEWHISASNDVIIHIPNSVRKSGGISDLGATWLGKWGRVLAFWFMEYVQRLECKESKESHIYVRLITFTDNSCVQKLVRSAQSFCDVVQSEPLNKSWRVDFIRCSPEESLFSRLFSNADVVIPSGIYVVTDTIWEHKDRLIYLDEVEHAVGQMLPVPLLETVRFLCYSIDNMLFIPSACVESKVLKESIAAAACEFSLEPRWEP